MEPAGNRALDLGKVISRKQTKVKIEMKLTNLKFSYVFFLQKDIKCIQQTCAPKN